MNFFLLLLAPVLAFAGEPTKVFFVGGFRASAAQMRCWEEGARKNSPGNYEFEGIPYPNGAGSGYDAAVGGAAKQIKRIVAEINAHPEKHYVIAGHSSGAAISNTIAKRAKDPKRLRQIVLDGFTSPRIPNAQCWGSLGNGYRSKKTGRVNQKPSRNFYAMDSCGKKNKRVYRDEHCNPASQWCLHFALVVKSTPPKLKNYRVDGYQGCDTNLDWLQ